MVNRKIYIGQTNDPRQRQAQYKSAAKYENFIQIITRTIAKYGFNNFAFEITGHSNGCNIFSLEQEKEICDLYLVGNISRTKLAKKYGCGKTTIRELLIRNGVKL